LTLTSLTKNMAQYIQKPGTTTEAVTLESQGFSDLQAAAHAGWSPVAAPAAPVAPATPATPVISSSEISTPAPPDPTPENTRLLGPTEFKNLSEGWKNVGLTADEIEKNFLVRQGSNIYLKKDAPAHESVIASRPIDQADTTEATPFAHVDKLSQFAETYLPSKTAAKTEAMAAEGVPELRDSITDQMAKTNEIIAKIEQKQADLELNNILDEEAKIALKNKIEGQAIPMSVINRQLLRETSDLSQQQRLDRLIDVYEINKDINLYNASNRNLQLLQGQYQMAMDNVRDTMDDWSEMKRLELMVLEEYGVLEKEARVRAEQEIEYQRGLAMQGFAEITSQEAYDKIVKDFNITADNFSQFIYKDPYDDRKYLRPSQDEMLSVSDAKALGVPYGTTKAQAAQMDITPRYVGSGSGSTPGIKLSSDKKMRLLGVGFTAAEVDQIESDINEYGIEAVIDAERMTEDQIKGIREIYSGVTPTQAQKSGQFLSHDYFKNLFDEAESKKSFIQSYEESRTDDELKEEAKDAGFRSFWSGWEKEKKNYLESLWDFNQYINGIMDMVELYRQANYTDQEILKMMR
jgi:hypothetical protein